MQYAYIESFEGWKDIFPSGNEIEFQNNKYIELDSTIIDTDLEAQFIRGKKAIYTAVCPVCQERLSFNKGTVRDNAFARKPFFFHPNRECFSYESLAHGHTKKYLYNLFEKAGYIVKEERRHSNLVRADVAVLQLAEGKEELKLAIEVQASNIRIGDIARRINTYFEEKVPTAWVLILDSFFPPKEKELNGDKIVIDGYSGTRVSNFNPETNAYDYEYISTRKEEYFFVTGSDNKAFNYLMDQYHVVLAVDHIGHVFLIRRTKESARLRIEAMLENRPHSTQDDKFKVSRVAESNIVPVLLETELLFAQYKENEKHSNHGNQEDEEFKGQIHISDYHKKELFDSSIEFDKAQEITDTLDSVTLARQTREELQKAYKQKFMELQLEKQQEERRKEEILAQQMLNDFLGELHKKYVASFSLLLKRLENEKKNLQLQSISDWYAWFKLLSMEEKQWSAFVIDLYNGFPDSYLREKNDFEEYYTMEKELYQEWIESREIDEFIEELRYHSNNKNEEHGTDIEQVMFLERLLHKYEHKMEEKRKAEAEERKRIERIRYEEKLLKDREEERIRRNKIDYWYSHMDILTKDYNESSQFSKKEIDDVAERFVSTVMQMDIKSRTAFERELFPLGLPQRIMKRKLKIEEKEINAIKRESKERMKQAAKNTTNDSKETDDGFVQLKLL
ncbi:hypothetical protein AB1284_25760 [Bacillus sp. S2(2024)]|uniref:competence protein CoiA family protein n=1 Tax=Bacillus sp. S2(2024) TaxID=3162887 RepID=UPI003D1E09CE